MFFYQFADPALNGAITTRVVIGHGILLGTDQVLTTGYTNSLIQSDGPVYVHISGYDLTPSNIDTSITLSGSGTNTASKTIEVFEIN